MYNFDVYPDGSGYAVDLRYTRPDHTLEEKKRAFFNFSKTTALHWAHHQFHKWLTDEYIRFVFHADILFKSGARGFYQTPRKINSMTLLKDYSRVCREDSIRGVVLQILNLEQEMYNVLPTTKNPSFKTSHERLEDMQAQCRRYRKIFIKSSS